MQVVTLIPFITLAALFGLLVLENRLGYRSPHIVGVTVKTTAVWWKKALVRWNNHIRYGGLFLFWLGSNAFAIQLRRDPDNLHFAVLGIAGIGVLVYAWGFTWRRFLVVHDKTVS